MGEKDITEVFVMLPLDSISLVNVSEINNEAEMCSLLKQAKRSGVKGVMVDVWWGLVEREKQREYEWLGYVKLLKLVSLYGLKLEAIMSFHACGNGPGDNVYIPLPKWVQEIAKTNPDIYYKDFKGNACPVSLSLGVDTVQAFGNRTGLDIYSDFMRSFCVAMQKYILDGTIVKVNVGCGACGELRYPSYNESFGWKYPGSGSFQCYDKYMLLSLAQHASKVSPSLGTIDNELSTPPTKCGDYHVLPNDSNFFSDEGDWRLPKGQFFLQWYSDELLKHGDRMLLAAKRVFANKGVKLAIKIPGIHWQYNSNSHSAELTAGFYNTCDRDGYLPLTNLCAKHGAELNFTCLEMTDERTNAEAENAASSPETLILQVISAAARANITLVGENAMAPIDKKGFAQLEYFASIAKRHQPSLRRSGPMASVTLLRAHDSLFASPHFNSFVRRMHGSGGHMKWIVCGLIGALGAGLGLAYLKLRR